MTTVHDCVKDTMVNYNSAFDTRWRVLRHVFFCIGTGYQWSGGGIYCTAHNPDRRWKADRKAPLSVRDFLVHFDEEQSKRKNNPNQYFLKKDDAVIALNRKFLSFHSGFLIEHIDELVDNNIALDDSQLPKNIDINGGNSLFWHPPVTMDKEWRDALVEVGTIMLELIKNRYANGDDSESAVWSCNVSKKTYFQMKEHVELVRTKKYKLKSTKK
jgi:hypothetical protein